MRHTITVLLATGCLALVGCSNSADHNTKPTPTATSSVTASTPAVDQLTACTDAIAAGESQEGPECASLSPDDLLKAVQEANRRGREALESAIESAGSQ